MAQCQEPHAQIVRLFLVFTYIWQEDVAKVQKCHGPRARSPTQCKSDPAMTWLVDVTIYCTLFNNKSPPPRQFLRDKTLLKKN